MEKRILIVPDVHLRSFWRPVMDIDANIIFLGDYVDPYSPLSYKENCNEFFDILDFASKNKDRVTLLIGNHDATYLGISDYTNRTESWGTFEEIRNIFLEHKDLFKVATQIDRTLFTHAGITKQFLTSYHNDWNSSNICEMLNEHITWKDIGQIGPDRGGDNFTGGPLWCDIHTLLENPAFKGELTQVVGHTRLKEGTIIQQDNIYCIDSQKIFEFHDNKVVIANI